MFVIKGNKMEQQAKCENCYFWQIDKSPLIKDEGFCKRNAPKPTFGFAVISKDDWCGEFKEKK